MEQHDPLSELIDEFASAIEEERWADAAFILSNLEVDVASAIVLKVEKDADDTQKGEVSGQILDNMTPSKAASILADLDPTVALPILKLMNANLAIETIHSMGLGAAFNLFNNLTDDQLGKYGATWATLLYHLHATYSQFAIEIIAELPTDRAAALNSFWKIAFPI